MTLTENKFKRTTIAGEFKNIDLPDGSDLANGYFQRNVQIGGDLDISGNIINAGLTNALNSKVSIDGSGYIINTELENALNSKVSMDTSGNIINSILDDQLASKASIVYVDGKIAELVDSSPATLDTLNELANALGDDPNFATTVSNSIGLKADKTYTDTQLALKANIISPTFSGSTVIGNLVHTGTINSPSIQTAINNTIATARNTLVSTNSASTIGSYLHFGNHAQAYTGFGTQAFGAISVNKGGGGNAEMNFIQNGSIAGGTYRAFNFMTATSNTTFDELMRINKNGDMVVTGNVTTPTINATTSIVSPTITTINTNIGLKSDITYVDSQLLLKDNVTSVDNKLLLKSDKTYVDTQLLLKDDITSVNTKLALKADITYVDDQLLLKDDVTSVDSKLLLKSDKTYVDNALSSLNNEFTYYDDEILSLQNQINNIEGNYNPSSDVTFQNLTVSGTITNTALTNLINTKANIANPSFTGTTNIVNFNNTGTFNSPALQTLLNTYVLTSAMNTALNLKANLSLVSNVNNTSDANKPVSTAQQTALDLKLNKTGDTLNTATLTGTTYFNGNVYQNASAGFYWYLAENGIGAHSSRLILGGYDAMVWDNPTATDIRFRWGATNIQRHTFSSNGALAIAGNFAGVNGNFSGTLSSPTITTINSNIATINSNISNVNNTSDANKPVSTAQQTALDLKANIANPSLTGTTNIVNLNHTGTIYSPAIQSLLNNYVLTTALNTALSTKVNTNSASTIGSYLHFGNHAQAYTGFGTQSFGAISVNKAGFGHAEMNFIQNGSIAGSTYRAFNFMIANSDNTLSELARINKNGDLVTIGNVTTPTINATTSIVSPTITTINSNIATINSSISNVNNTSDANKPVSTAQQTALNLKANIDSPSFTGTTTVNNFVNNGTFHSPALQTTLNNYALLNSSPTFTGDVKAKTYTGNLVRSATSSNTVFTPSTLPSTIIKDSGVSTGSFGIPNMPIGTRFTVMKTSPAVTVYSTDANVYFYTRRTSPFWTGILTFTEDSRTFIRAEIINPSNLAMVQVWLTESSHTYNQSDNVTKAMVGAWMLDGADYGTTAGTYRPIICSCRVFGPGNSDDGFIVNEGFALVVYTGENYTGTAYTLSNYFVNEDPRPARFNSPSLNNMQSCKLYYNTVEITIQGISD